jgi:hypothetical protein
MSHENSEPPKPTTECPHCGHKFVVIELVKTHFQGRLIPLEERKRQLIQEHEALSERLQDNFHDRYIESQISEVETGIQNCNFLINTLKTIIAQL